MKRMRLVLTLALAAVLIVSGGMFIHQLLDYRAGDAAYEEAAEIAKLPEPASEPPEAPAEAPAAEPTPEPSAEPQTDPLASIDLAALQAVNADVLGWLSIPVTIIWIVAITNAVNFIDGLDGLAVGVSAISTASLIVIALMVKEVNIVIILCALFGACLGFIPYNMNPAKIFMGDTGSTFLGYILATLSITGLFKMYAIISFAVPFLILGIPIFDICFAFLRRIAHGQNPMKADRGHFHHRLIDMGFSQKQSVAIAYMLTGMLGLAAVLLTSSGELKALILIAAIFIVSAIGFRLIFSKNDPAEDASSPEPEEKQEGPHE